MIHLCIFFLFLPKLLLLMLIRGKYRKSFFKRFGMGVPKIDKKGKPLYLFHAVSMGEVLAAKPVIDQLKKEIPGFTFVVSTTTETGQERAKSLFPEAAAIIYWPFDFYFSVKRVFRRINPNYLILTEGDFWFGALTEAKRRNVQVSVINGKISESSSKRFAMFPAFSKKMFGLIDLYCVQSPLFASRFERLGVPKSLIVVTGNVKADVETRILGASDLAALKERFGIDKDDFIVVAGSTHSPEEDLIVQSLPEKAKLILVPRHPERFSAVYSLLCQKGISVARLSQLTESSSLKQNRVLLIDTMGLLIQCYQVADVAIVAGSFTEKVGGHNIVEPAQYGVPTLVGPYMFSQSALFESAKDMDAIIQVSNGLELKKALTHLMNDPAAKEEAGKKALRFVEAMRGATDRTCKALGAKGT